MISNDTFFRKEEENDNIFPDKCSNPKPQVLAQCLKLKAK